MSNIDKQALRISELEELNELLREKVKKLESDLWDKEQLRQVYSEKSFDLECKVRELEARNQKDFVWRGKEISRLNDEVDELKEKLGAAEMQIVNLKQNCENDPRIHEIVDLKESVAELATENARIKTAASSLVSKYILNKGMDCELIACITPSKKTIGTGGVWDMWRLLDLTLTEAEKTRDFWNKKWIIRPYFYTPPASEREQIRREHAEWSDATFGDVGPVGPLKHLSKEALEAAAIPSDPLEWADMQFLLWDAQRRAGITDEQITQAMIEKLAINKSRQWPEPKDGEPRLHIKEQPVPVVPPAIEPDYKVIKSILPTTNPDEYACCIAADMWNACRSAMLNGGKS